MEIILLSSKSSKAACICLFALIFTLHVTLVTAGTWTTSSHHIADENRVAAALPTFSRAQFLDAKFTGKVEKYLADRFGGRSLFIEGGLHIRSQMNVSNPSGAPTDVAVALNPAEKENQNDLGEIFGDVGGQSENEEGEEGEEGGKAQRWGGASTKSNALRVGNEPAKIAQPAKEGERTAAKTNAILENTKRAPSKQVGSILRKSVVKARMNKRHILIFGDRAMTRYLGRTKRKKSAYADSINRWRREVSSHVKVYVALLPNAAGFYGPTTGRYTCPPQQPNLQSHFDKMSGDIIKIDGYNAMKPHIAEHLFFKTDHHWTARGAYYVYKSLVEAGGLTAPPLSSLNRVVVAKKWRGSFWGMTNGAKELRGGDVIEVFEPKSTYTGRFWTKSNPKRSREKPWINAKARSYLAFIGMSYPRIQAETSVKNGRKVLVVMNSYGNPFVTLLLNSFETVIGIDYRYFKGNLRKLVKDEGVTDLVFLNGIQTFNARHCARRLNSLLGGVKRSR